MQKYKNYDIAVKVAYVEEYLDRIKTEKCTIADFAFEKEIADSTFNDWIVKYRKDKDRFINSGYDDNDTNNEVVTTAADTSNNCELPAFIELTKHIAEKPKEQNLSFIKLSYKDITIEFNNQDLERVMEIIRRW